MYGPINSHLSINGHTSETHIMDVIVPLVILLLVTEAGASRHADLPAGAAVTSSRTMAPMEYWQAALPETPVPQAIHDLLTQSTTELDEKALMLKGVKKHIILYGQKAKEESRRITGTYTSQSHKDPRKITEFYGYQWEEDPRKTTVSFGSLGEEDLSKTTMSYGSQGEGDSRKITTAYGLQEKEDSRKITSSYGSQGGKNSRKITTSYGLQDKQNSRKITTSYGSQGGEDSRKITALYGSQGGEDSRKITTSYVLQEKDDSRKITASYGSRGGENSRKITASYGLQDKQNSRKITTSYGSQGGEDSRKITTSYGSHGKEDSRKITASYESRGEDNSRKITTSYESQGDRHDHVHSRNRGNNLADVFFFRDVLRPGSVIKPTIPTTTSLPPLLSRRDADSLPFSTERFGDILAMFAPASLAMADEIRWTLDTCEHPRPLSGEKAGCATSLESLAKLPATLLGTRNIRAFSGDMPIDAVGTTERRGRYNVTAVQKLSESATAVTCHDLTYPYAVFYCHTTNPAATYYMVTLTAEDGRAPAMEALAVCHLDTSLWSPRQPFLMAHNLKPGDVAVCHFLSKLSVIWVPSTELGGASEAR